MGIPLQNGHLIAPVDLGNTYSDEFSSFIPIQAGYKYYLNSKIDLGIRFNVINAFGGDFHYLGVRAAYHLL